MRFILGFITALVVLAFGAFLVVWTGAYNVAASAPHFAFLRWVLDATVHNSVERRARDIQVPARFTQEQVRNGFKTFDAVCARCHGGPGVKRAEWASGMRPNPPSLSEHAAHWNAAQIFWIVKHGIKMSGMPALGSTHKDEELWNVVAFVGQLPAMTPEAYARLKEELGSPASQSGHRALGEGQEAGQGGAPTPAAAQPIPK